MPGPLSKPPYMKGLFVKRSNNAVIFGVGITAIGTALYSYFHIYRAMSAQWKWEATQTPETIEREYLRMKEFGAFQHAKPSWMSLKSILTDEQKKDISRQYINVMGERIEERKAEMRSLIEESDLPEDVKQEKLKMMLDPSQAVDEKLLEQWLAKAEGKFSSK